MTAIDLPAPRRSLPWLPGLLFTLAVLALVEAFSRSGIVSTSAFPPVSDDVRAFARLLGEAKFWSAVGNTLEGWGIGLGIAIAIAIPLGVLIGAMPLFYRASRVIVEFLRPIPSVALVPLAVLVYGTGLKSKIFLVAFASLWPILLQTMYGVRDVDPVALDTARSFRFGAMDRLRRVTLPSAVPYIATGLRISSSVALILAVTTELVIGSPGLGREVTISSSGGAYDVMYGYIIANGLMGWGLNGLFVWAERRALHWHPSVRARGDRA
jgi:ABC-type nitrate/sulfonate/bicarbonate transport system permease component